MPLPRIDSNIANVSMDYFLRGVDAAKAQGAQAQALLPEDNPPAAPEEHPAGKLELDVLLTKTADAAAKSLKALGKFTGRELAGGYGADEAPLGTGKITVQKHGGQEKRIGGEIAKDVNERFCPSYFARDGIDKLFAYLPPRARPRFAAGRRRSLLPAAA